VPIRTLHHKFRFKTPTSFKNFSRRYPMATIPVLNPASLDLWTWQKRGAYSFAPLFPAFEHVRASRCCSCSMSEPDLSHHNFIFSRYPDSFGAKHPMAMRALVLVAQSQVFSPAKLLRPYVAVP
jgi:hypothetical protein